MSSDVEMEKRIAELMRDEATRRGLDPNRIDSEKVSVDSTGPTVTVAYGDAKVTVPAPSQFALDQWFGENGKYIAGSLTTLLAVVVGAAIGRR